MDQKLLQLWLVATSYMLVVVLALQNIHLWELARVKETVFWFVGTGLATCLTLTNEKEPQHLLWKLFAENLKAIVVLNLVLTTYTFGLIVELVLVPVASILVACSTLANYREEHRDARGVLQGLLSGIGFLMLGRALWGAWQDRHHLLSTGTLWDLAYPVFLALAFLPFWWFFSLLTNYETLFLRMKVVDSDGSWSLYARRKIVQKFHVRLIPLKRFITEFRMHGLQSNLDVDIEVARAQQRVEESLRGNVGNAIEILSTKLIDHPAETNPFRILKVEWQNCTASPVRRVDAKLIFSDAEGKELETQEYTIFATANESPGVAPNEILSPNDDDGYFVADNEIAEVVVEVIRWSHRGY